MDSRVRGNTPRQVLIAVDAAEWTLITKWARAGALPTFQRLMNVGAQAELATTAAQLPDTVWPAICTGVNPARFGKYYYVQYEPRTMGLRQLYDDVIERPPFWDHLSRAGRRVGLVDVPLFPLSQSINGFHLANWGVHPVRSKRASVPASLLADVESRFGQHPGGDCGMVDDKPEPLRAFRGRLLDSVRVLGRMIRTLMQEHRSDVFVATFTEAHCAGHLFWQFLDPPPSRPLTEDTHDLVDTMEQIYRAIDREIGEILASLDDGTEVMVFAGHGMGPLYHASWNLKEILDLLGYGRTPARRAEAGSAARAASINPWRILKMTVPGPLQYWIKARLPKSMQDQLLFRWYAGNARWDGCRAFAIPNNESVGTIRISVKGRDRNGLVEPGAEYRQVCREITEALCELTDVKGGRRIVRQVTCLPDVFAGPFLDQLPDLTVLWEQSFFWDSLYSPRFGELRLRRQDARSGSHTPHGFLLAAGPSVPAGVELRGRSIYDIAPTVLERAWVPIPGDLEGTPLWRADATAGDTKRQGVS